MTSFLLLLSFLIHLILFITIYHVYERVKRDKDEQAEQLERMLANFMNDIRLENSKLEQKIHENELRQNINYDYRQAEEKQAINEEQEMLGNKTVTAEPPTLSRGKTMSKYESNSSMEENRADVIETSLESRVMQLFAAGKSVDEIAKQLNRGKTEVDLLIKLNRKANI